MSHCIEVTLKDGSTVMANVDDGVTKLEPEDIQALEEWVAIVKARNAKKKAREAPQLNGEEKENSDGQ